MTGSVWVVPVGDNTDAVLAEAHRVADLLGETGDRPSVVALGFGAPETVAYETVAPDEIVGIVATNGSFRNSAAMVSDRVAALAKVARERDPRLVLAESTPDGDDLMTGVSNSVDGACVTDCLVRVRDGELFAGRQVYQGRAYAKLALDGVPALSVDGEVLGTPDERLSESLQTSRHEVSLDRDQRVRHLTDLEIPEQDLSRAQVIVAGGRGLGGPDGFEPVQELANAVGGTLGASRPPADEGWVPYDRQIGVTGTEIEPELYIPLAISGDPYHMRSVSATHMIPINNDPEARIFDFADVGIQGDVFEYAPVLAEAIVEERKQKADRENAVTEADNTGMSND